MGLFFLLVRKLKSWFVHYLQVRESTEEAAKVDVEQGKGGKEALVEPAMMGECFEIKPLFSKENLSPADLCSSQARMIFLFSMLYNNC